MVVKQPFYGFGMRVVPKARFDSRRLHILYISAGLLKTAAGLATGFTIGNRVGRYCTGSEITIRPERPLILQIDGDMGWEDEIFSFKVLPKALKIKH